MQLKFKNRQRGILFPSLLVSLWAVILTERVMLFVMLMALTVAILVYDVIIHGQKFPKKNCVNGWLNRFKNMYDENAWYALFTKNKYLMRISEKLSVTIHSDIMTAGVAIDPYFDAIRNLGRTVLFFLVSVPTSLLLWTYFDHPIFLATIAMIPIILMWSKIKLIILTSERKSKIGDEVAFFSIYAWVLQTVGGTLVDIISGIRGSGLLPYMEKEAEMMSRDMGFFPENPLDVVNKRALQHPNHMLRNLFVGYVSIYKDGGDLINYMEKTTENLFSQLEFRFRRYEEQAKNLAILTNAIFSMLPIFLVTGMFIMSVDALSSLISLTFIMLPLIGISIYAMVDFVQPKFADDVKFNPASVLAGTIGGMFGYFVLDQIWLAITFGTLFFAVINTILSFKAIAEISSTNTVLGDFLRDVTESRKVGNPISVTIHRLANNRKYNGSFDRIIFDIATRLHFGTPLSKCVQHNKNQNTVRMRSWLSRMIFFMLGKMEEAGDVSAQSLEILTKYMTKIKNARQELNSALQVFWILAYVNPFIMVYISKMLKGWFENNSITNNLEINYMLFETLAASPEFIGLINITIALSSIMLGILMNKIVNFNMLNTKNLIIISIITLIAIWAEPLYPTSL